MVALEKSSEMEGVERKIRQSAHPVKILIGYYNTIRVEIFVVLFTIPSAISFMEAVHTLKRIFQKEHTDHCLCLRHVIPQFL